jgi:hypothetical protein
MQVWVFDTIKGHMKSVLIPSLIAGRMKKNGKYLMSTANSI